MIRVSPPTSVDQIVGMPGGIFISFITPRTIPSIVWVISDPVKLTININHYTNYIEINISVISKMASLI